MVLRSGAAPRYAPSAVQSRVPVYRSAAPSSMEAVDAVEPDLGVEQAGLPLER
jgi:hypothetical protein